MNVDEWLKSMEHKLRDVQSMMKNLHPNFNSVPNAERFILCCLQANECLRQMQRGNDLTVDKYWPGDDDE